MLNSIPVIGWLFSLVINVSLSLPFWLCWTVFGLGKTYFDFLPMHWQSIPFWHCVGLFTTFSIIKTVAAPNLAPILRIDSSESTRETSDE